MVKQNPPVLHRAENHKSYRPETVFFKPTFLKSRPYVTQQSRNNGEACMNRNTLPLIVKFGPQEVMLSSNQLYFKIPDLKL